VTTLSALAFRDAPLLRPPKPATAQTQTLPPIRKQKNQMREFGKTPKNSWFLTFVEILATIFFWTDFKTMRERGFQGHNERVESRRRKTKFHRWRK